ncbi:MAG: DUF4386 family protein, partial [Pseudomonadota bacterium]
ASRACSRLAGVAAMVQAVCYVVGFVMLATVMNPGDVDGWSARQKLEFILERETLFQLWNIVIYVVFGVALVALAATLHRLLAVPDTLLMSIATPFGFIWAGLVIASGMVANVGVAAVSRAYANGAADEAVSLWSAVGVVQDGLGGGVEVVGGLWVLLVSAAALRAGILLPSWVNWLGLIVGLAGIATIVPSLGGLGAVFGLTQILWFLGVGAVLLLRKGEDRSAPGR